MLKNISCLASLIGLATILLPSIALTQTRIVYNPPSRRTEAPNTNNSSATRGCDKDLIESVTSIAPSDHTGLTVSARPTLLYFVKKKTTRASQLAARSQFDLCQKWVWYDAIAEAQNEDLQDLLDQIGLPAIVKKSREKTN